MCDDKERDVVLAFGCKYVVGVGSGMDGLQFKPRFFAHLSHSTLRHRLTKLKMSTRQRPGSGAMRAEALTEQYQAIADDDYADADE